MIARASNRFTKWGFRAYVGSIGLAGALLAVWSLALHPWSSGPNPVLFGVLVALTVAGETRVMRWLSRSGANHVTPTWAFIAALVFTTTGFVAATVTMAASAVGDVVDGHRPSRVVFNASMLGLSVAAGIGVLVAFGQRDVLAGGGRIDAPWAVATVLSLGTVFLVNSLLLSGVIALNEGVPLARILRRDAFVNFSTDGVLLTIGPPLVVLGQASLLLLAPLVLVWYLVFRSGEIAARRGHEATHDPLTSLPNRRLYLERLGTAVAHRGTRSSGVLAVLIIDLDDFKEINDNLGHDVGDAVLIELASRLKDRAPNDVVVARLGGDEFAALVEEAGSTDEVWALGRGLHAAASQPLVSNGFPLTVTASVGMALIEPGSPPITASHLMRRADVAMYSAKASREGVVAFGREVTDDSAPGRVALVSQLGDAIGLGQLRVHYQPITDVRRSATQRLEALVRWEHPSLGLIGPDDFVPMAEQTDLIGALTIEVLDAALASCARWQAHGHQVGVAINLSARLLVDLAFPELLAKAADRAALPPSAITLEITENAVLRQPARAARVLGTLRELGVRVAIDDFGTGFSSLASLRDLPVDELKIDRRFSTAVLEGRDDEVIVRTVVALAGELGLATVAEGAETAPIADRLVELGCDVLQGFHLARPMPPEEVEEWLSRPPPPVARPARNGG